MVKQPATVPIQQQTNVTYLLKKCLMFRFNIISHKPQSLQTDLTPTVFPTIICLPFSMFPTCHICPDYPILLNSSNMSVKKTSCEAPHDKIFCNRLHFFALNDNILRSTQFITRSICVSYLRRQKQFDKCT
jgi:hypothetical protein